MATGFTLLGLPQFTNTVAGTVNGSISFQVRNDSARTGTITWSNATPTLPTVYSVGGATALPAPGASVAVTLPFSVVGADALRTTQLTTFAGTLSTQPDGAVVGQSIPLWIYDGSTDDVSIFDSYSANTGGTGYCYISDLRFVCIARADNGDGGVDIYNAGDCPALIRVAAAIPTLWYGEVLKPGQRRCILAQELAGGLNVYAACPQSVNAGVNYIPGWLQGVLVCTRRLDCVPTGTNMSVFPETLT